jgi:hypothetical protein
MVFTARLLAMIAIGLLLWLGAYIRSDPNPENNQNFSSVHNTFKYSYDKYTLTTKETKTAEKLEQNMLVTTRTISFKNNLTLIIHKVFNGDVVYFAQYHPVSNTNCTLILAAKDPSPVVRARYLSYAENIDIAKNYWVEKTFDAGLLPKQTLFINDMVISLVDVFTPAANETVKENYSLSPSIVLSRTADRWEYKITMPGIKDKVVSHWGVLSKDPLVNWDFEATNQQIRLADLNRARKLLPWGFMEKVASTYVPGNEDTFWWCPHQVVGEAFLRHDETKNRVFTDISTVVLYAVIKRQNDRGYWFSTPASSWLGEEYGIGSYYFDTRFCSDAGMYLLQAYEKHCEPKALESAQKYGDYLLTHITRGKKTGTGILSSDYWSNPDPRELPHTSLNHQLAEMNFLYRLYLNTGDERYRESAVLLKNGIRDTGLKWVNPEGDLWYCVTRDGLYEKPDYQTLTLMDLIRANKYIAEVEGQEDDVIEQLRAVKYRYAKQKKYINW